MTNTKSWQILGYVAHTLPGPQIVEPIIHTLENPNVWFFPDNPEKDVRTYIMSLPKRTASELPTHEGLYAVELEEDAFWRNRDLQVVDSAGVLLSVNISAEDIARFERLKKVVESEE